MHLSKKNKLKIALEGHTDLWMNLVHCSVTSPTFGQCIAGFDRDFEDALDEETGIILGRLKVSAKTTLARVEQKRQRS